MTKITTIMVFSVTIFLVVFACSMAGPVPDTGQTTSYTDTFGEDSDYLINPPSYTKLDASGNDLADDAKSWTMARDNVTGLIWEVKTDDGSVHDKDNQYTWYDSNPDTNGDYPGTVGDGTDTEDFINDLNSSNYGGYSDWRLPTIDELQSIVDYEKYEPAINDEYFSNTLPSYYWSSTPLSYNPYIYYGMAWSINFDHGKVDNGSKSNTHYVRAVRGGLPGPFDNLVSNSDGTVTDTATGLMWQQGTDGKMNWEASLDYCENLSLAGYSDWRLPTTKELISIVEFLKDNSPINIDYFPNTVSSYYWSSTTSAAYSGDVWRVLFNYVDIPPSPSIESDACYVRAVRGGQPWSLGNLVISTPEQASFWELGNIMGIIWETGSIVGNVKISLSRDGGKTYSEIIVSTPNDGSHDWTVTGPVSANCLLKIESLEKGFENHVTAQGLFIIKSTVPLTASISGASEDPTNQTSATLTIGDTSIISYKYKLNDESYSSEILVFNTIDLLDLSDGINTVYVVGRDASGAWQSTDNPTTETWTVDTTKPVIIGLTNDAISAQSKTWTWDAMDSSTATFRYLIDQNETWAEPSGDYSDTKTVAKSEADGIWYIHVQAKDAAGNESDVVTVSAVLDNTAPAAAISGAPISPSNQSGATLIVGGDGVTHYKYKLDDADAYSSEIAVGTGFTLVSLSDGSHTVYVLGRDAADNWQSTDNPTTASWTVDTTVPGTTTTTTTVPVITTTTPTTTTVPVITTTTIPSLKETIIDLSSGWNLINSCLKPSDTTVSSILSYVNGNISSVWKWFNGNWAVCLPNELDEGAAYASGKGFSFLEEINTGEGFWVNSDIAQTLTVSGIEPLVKSFVLESGWNLVGIRSKQAKSITDLIGENSAKIVSVWKWDNGAWAVFLPDENDGGAAYAANKGFTMLETINPGEGFWVNVTQQVTLD